MVKRFEKANRLARKKAEEIKGKYLAIIQNGSSLREEDFTPHSDVDLYGITKKKPEDLFDHFFEEDVNISIIQKSSQEFEKDLEKGNPFELISVKYGKILHGKNFLQKYKTGNYSSGRRTYMTWIQSAINHYQNMIFDRYMPIEFYNSSYHSYREFSRYLILEKFNKIVEGDSMVKENLKDINNQLAKRFWELREKRYDPPSSHDYMEIEDFLQAEEYKIVQKVDKIGKKVFEREEMTFPTLEKISELLRKRGIKVTLSPHYSFREDQKIAFLSGEDENGDHRSFQYDMETCDLEEIGKDE